MKRTVLLICLVSALLFSLPAQLVSPGTALARNARGRTKRFRHPSVGELELYCELIDNRDQQQTLIVFTAEPGSESAEKLRLLSVLGSQVMNSGQGFDRELI